jgi:D-alanyl-D-alanine carboxypeptidase
MEKLWLLMRDLRANGVQQVTGDLVLDRSFFNQPQLPEFNDDGNDENKPFLVKPDALLVNLKALRFVRATIRAECSYRWNRRLPASASTTRSRSQCQAMHRRCALQPGDPPTAA